MEIKELRVGNWSFDEDGILCKINGFQPYGHSVRCDEEEGCLVLIDLYPQDGEIKQGYECDLHSLKPIPLTEEVLLKCGFEKIDSDENNFWMKLRYGNILFDSDESINCSIVYTNVGLTRVGVQYLHKLQNLYFALTGEELTYNHS